MIATSVREIDQQVRDELAPPCECLVGAPAKRCTRSAAWAVTVRCGVDGELSDPLLVCSPCIEAFTVRRVTCMCHPGSTPVRIVSVIGI